MPAKDLYHDCVKNALVKDGWTITEDPYRVRIEERDAYIDLAAERPFAAERGQERIAVEVKSFRGPPNSGTSSRRSVNISSTRASST